MEDDFLSKSEPQNQDLLDERFARRVLVAFGQNFGPRATHQEVCVVGRRKVRVAR